VTAASHAMVLLETGEEAFLAYSMMENRLDLLEEMRNAAAEKAMATQAKDVENHQARWETPQVGDLVLKRRYELDTQRSKKLEARWIGPYVLAGFLGTLQRGKRATFLLNTYASHDNTAHQLDPGEYTNFQRTRTRDRHRLLTS